MGGNAFDVMVDEADHSKANAVVQRFFMSSQSQFDEPSGSKNYFRRVIVFSFIGIILLPLVFNWIATLNYISLRKQGPSVGRLVTATVILISCWLIALAEISLFLQKAS
jgi:hypothetical protein